MVAEVLSEMGNLRMRDVTLNPNGYPEPYIGAFVDGFGSMDELKEFIGKFGGDIAIAHSKDGWHNCELSGALIGRPIEEFTIIPDGYGDDYTIIMNREELEREAACILDEVKKSPEEIAEMDAAEKKEYELRMDRHQEKVDELMNVSMHINWDKNCVILRDGYVHDTPAKKSMSISLDTNHATIGVFFPVGTADTNAVLNFCLFS